MEMTGKDPLQVQVSASHHPCSQVNPYDSRCFQWSSLRMPFINKERVEEKDLPTSSRHYLAMKKLINDNNFDAIAIRCWPELPGPAGLGQWPYMALARLATEGVPVACEGDVDGAMSCLVAKFLGCGAVYLSDSLCFLILFSLSILYFSLLAIGFKSMLSDCYSGPSSPSN